MGFPVSPTNGQQATVNGVIYTYSSALSAWTVTTNSGNDFTANNITTTNEITSGTDVYAFGDITAAGNITGDYILGNGALLSGVITSVSNINLGTSNVTVVSSGGNVAVGVGGSGNIAVFSTTGEYVTGVISATGNISGGNLTTGAQVVATGNVTGGNLNTGAQVVATGNITGGNLNTGAQVVATGNVSGGNLITAGQVVATGNIVSSGNISAGNLIAGANVIITNGSLLRQRSTLQFRIRRWRWG
jgi:hypothetical protein